MNLLKLTLATLIFVMSFAMQSNEAEAQSCPTGMTYTVVTMMIDGCEYHVEICYSCGMTHPGEVRVMGFTRVDPNCVTSLDAHQIVQQVYSQVKTYQFIYQNLCSNYLPELPPPCPNGNLVTERSWACWKIEMINYLGEETLKYSPCNYDAYCEEVFAHCWDENVQEIVKIIISEQMVGVPSCTLEGWEVTVPRNIGEVSECYIYHTPCDE